MDVKAKTSSPMSANDLRLIEGVADSAAYLFDRLANYQTNRNGRPTFTADQAHALVLAAMPALTEALAL